MFTPCAHRFPAGVQVISYIHKIYGCRYNWHRDMYEIDIVLKGRLEFYRGGEKFVLEKDDLIIINPGVGHASYPLDPDTDTLVLRFSANALRDFSEAGKLPHFSYASTAEDRCSQPCRMLRYYAAILVLALRDGAKTKEDKNVARSSLGFIARILARELPSQLAEWKGSEDVDPEDGLMTEISTYIAEHHAEKLTLQNVADRFHYNRTYLSTIFKDTMHIGFHDYLTRVRLQMAIGDLGIEGKNLLDIAIDHGFPDQKAFSRLFSENFGVSPKEYRRRMQLELSESKLIPSPGAPVQSFKDPKEPRLQAILDEYLTLFP
ncbi:MAG: helix-turn-helix domain-containing protein [Firmicutes bacterium]|nr:helix-turn-helix domain-containing protein [Bacillota bacterium]